MGGGSCMVWASFSLLGTSNIAFIDGRMNSNGYQALLEKHLIPYMARWPNIEFTFQQDNAPVHSSASTRNWLNDNNISVLDWPARSSDLNPIENLWGVLARSVYAESRQFSSVNQLKDAIEHEWSKITQAQLENLVNSMKNRLVEVLKNKGGITSY